MTEPSHLTAVRESYDTVAVDYAARVKSPAELDPLSRAMPAVFAEMPHRAGLVVTARLVQEPGEGMKRRVATFLAAKPQ
ncbi:hypothetical protein ACWCP6_21570 [Streptomyces sp. NPDC002004]